MTPEDMIKSGLAFILASLGAFLTIRSARNDKGPMTFLGTMIIALTWGNFFERFDRVFGYPAGDLVTLIVEAAAFSLGWIILGWIIYFREKFSPPTIHKPPVR